MVIGIIASLTDIKPVQAHAQLVRAVPGISSIIHQTPKKVTLTFDDDLLALSSSNLIAVYSPANQRVDQLQTRLSGSSLSVDLKTKLPFGRYKVTYRVISADGHPVSASYYFYFKK
jgi:methionine-rich copper-binding protein CopC